VGDEAETSSSPSPLLTEVRYLIFKKNKCMMKIEAMIPRFKKVPKVINQHLEKGQFLEEHNRLSPLNLQATTPLLSRFRIEKASLFKDDNWSIDKLRRPFILWLTSLTDKERQDIGKKKI